MSRFSVFVSVTLLGLWSATTALSETGIFFNTPGAEDDLRDAVIASSLLRQAQRENVTDTQELLAAAQADYARLLGVLYSKARYGSVINILVDGREAAAIPPLNPPDRINRITVRVTAGPPYLFSNATVAPLAPGTEVPVEFARGQTASTDVIRQTADVAIEGWRLNGHAKAEIEAQRIIARHSERRLSARLKVAPGPKLRFGQINVEGNEDVSTRRVLKIAGLQPGTTYDPTEIERALKRLRRTGTFRSVVVDEADQIGPNRTLPLTIGVVEQTPRRFGVGAEYSTVDGLRLSGFWLHRNLLGGAERFRVDAEVAGITGETGGTDYSLGVRIERPATPRADVDAYIEATYEAMDEPDFESETAEVVLGFTRYATDDLTVDFGAGFLYSDVTDDFGRETYTLLTLPLSAVYERRNDQLNPTDGYFVDLEVTPFKGLSGTESGVRTALDARGYESFGQNDRLTFAARLQLGSLAGPDLLDSPPFYRFYSGGGGTVRGQDYQSLAVDLGGGNRRGGRSFLGLSGEIRAGVTENIQLVGFADWGYVGSEAFPELSGDSHAGAGLGVRYNTGIGPIRLDVAVPVAGDTEASDFYLYIGIGQAF